MVTVKPRVRKLAASLTAGAILAAIGCAEPDSQDVPRLLRPNGDALAVGSTVQLSDSAFGDVMTAGGSVSFAGVAGGSYVGAGGEQTVGGRVEGSVRVAAGQVVVTATVGRNVTLAGGNVEVRDPAEIERNAYLAAGRVLMTGSIGGDLYAGGGEVVIDGTVAGDVRVEADRFTLGPDARIGGELRYRVRDEAASIDPQAVVSGGLEALPPPEDDGGGVLWFALRMLAFVLCGTVVVALFPGVTDSLAGTMGNRPAAAVGLGFLWLLLVPIGAVATAATFVGLPLAAISAGLFAISVYLAPIVPAVWVGAELVPGPSKPGAGNRIGEFLAGGLIVAFAILLPWVGWFARFLATVLGLGAVVLALARAWSARRGVAAEGDVA